MRSFGFDFEKVEQEGAVRILDLMAFKNEEMFSNNIELILSAVNEVKAERLVIDSVTAFLSVFSDRAEYRLNMHLIYKMLKNLGCTTIMTCSMPIGTKNIGLGIEESIADSLILLENVTEGIELKTRLLIHKMRGTNHSRKYHNVMITDKGLEIVPFTV